MRYHILGAFLIVSSFGYSQQSDFYLKLGDSFLDKNEYDSAIYAYETGLEKCLGCHDTLTGWFHAQIGRASSLNYQKEEALTSMLLALDLFNKSNFDYGRGKIHIYLAEYFRGLGQYSKANFYLQKFEDLDRKISLPLELQAYYYNRKAAIINESTGDTAEVIKYSNYVLEIAKTLDIKNDEASSCNELGYLYTHNGQVEKGAEFYNKALTLFKETGELHLYIGTLLNLVRLHGNAGNEDKSFELSLKGLQLIESHEFYNEKRELYLLIHSHFMVEKNYKEAMFYYRKHQEYNYKIMVQEFSEKRIQIEKEYDLENEKKATLRELERADFAEKEVERGIKEKRILIVYISVLVLLVVTIMYLFFRLRLTNKKLEKNLEQKSILFQELHHRVKNNLTLLNSLLFLRAKRSDNKEVKEVLTECQNRVHSIALVHQNLYQVEDTSKINLALFVKQLFNELGGQISENKTLSEVIILGYEQEVEMSLGVFIGLTLNELFTNTLKYANPENGKLSVKVDFQKEKGRLFVTYCDNGQGLSENVTLEENGGFGFKMIQITMDQLNTSMTYEKTDEFSIFRFSVKV